MQKTTKTRRPISGPRETDGRIQADVSSRPVRLVGPPPRHTKPSVEPSVKHADELPDEKGPTSGSALVHGATVSMKKNFRRQILFPLKTDGQYLTRPVSPVSFAESPSLSMRTSSDSNGTHVRAHFPLSWATSHEMTK